jgi:hypothetical protein
MVASEQGASIVSAEIAQFTGPAILGQAQREVQCLRFVELEPRRQFFEYLAEGPSIPFTADLPLEGKTPSTSSGEMNAEARPILPGFESFENSGFEFASKRRQIPHRQLLAQRRRHPGPVGHAPEIQAATRTSGLMCPPPFRFSFDQSANRGMCELLHTCVRLVHMAGLRAAHGASRGDPIAARSLRTGFGPC